MKLRKRNAFTLIELIATLVIMAIIALIATPLVMNIIRKARVSADKRSVDAYGRSIELAIAGYLLDTGKFPTEVSQLTIEYSGNKVECETTQINTDSSVYLSNCKVNNREVTNYSYGTNKSLSYEAYSVGDEVTYNGVDYYVLKDSGTKDNVVTLLKATPLTTEEVNLYGGVGTNNNHVNKYTSDSVGTAYDNNGYGGMAYYTSNDCNSNNNLGCFTSYNDSDIKYIVDTWAENRVPSSLKESRLIKKDEYSELTVEETYDTPTQPGKRFVPQYSWMSSRNYYYWTMTSQDESISLVYVILQDGSINSGNVYSDRYQGTVRPVVELYKNDGITRKNS